MSEPDSPIGRDGNPRLPDHSPSLRDLIRRLRPVPCGHPLIRIGGDGDGGYLVPDDLEGLEACFSPGVGRVASFEESLFRRGISSHMIDGSVDRPPFLGSGMTFDRLFLSSRDGPDCITLGRWMRRHRPRPEGDLLLQMDIEGSEYEAIPSFDPADLARFRIVVVEFHRLHLLADPFLFRILAPAFEKLLDGFAVVHLHPNNNRPTVPFGDIDFPRAMEFTFLRRDRLRPGGDPPVIPHPLDRDCVPAKPPVALPEAWRPDGRQA